VQHRPQHASLGHVSLLVDVRVGEGTTLGEFVAVVGEAVQGAWCVLRVVCVGLTSISRRGKERDTTPVCQPTDRAIEEARVRIPFCHSSQAASKRAKDGEWECL
jgi:hypothetical protein